MVQKKELQEVLTAYGLEERVACIQAYGNGHINDTLKSPPALWKM